MTSFAVDQKKYWTPHCLKPRPGKKTLKGKFRDQHGIECKLSMNVLAAKNSSNLPVIYYASPGGWETFVKVRNRRAPYIEAIIDK